MNNVNSEQTIIKIGLCNGPLCFVIINAVPNNPTVVNIKKNNQVLLINIGIINEKHNIKKIIFKVNVLNFPKYESKSGTKDIT